MRYCVCCAANLQQTEEVMLEGAGKVVGSFERTLEVKRDKDTGEVIGWDDFFAHIEKTDKIHGKMI